MSPVSTVPRHPRPQSLRIRRQLEVSYLRTWAYVFISTPQPKKVVRLVRRIPGVILADALFGSPDVVALVAGNDVADMDAVIDRIAELRPIVGTDSKVARWIDSVEPPGVTDVEAGEAQRTKAVGVRRGRTRR